MKTVQTRKVADKTRKIILKAASKLFAAHGYAGTATNAIAKTAKLNEALIFHHFGNKENLWHATKNYLIESISEVPSINMAPNSFKELLEDILAQRIFLFTKCPRLIRFIQWQQLEINQAKLITSNRFSPDNWVEPLLYLQGKNKIKSMPIKILILWLAASFNTIFTDKNAFFKGKKFRQDYIDEIVLGFCRALEM